MSGHGWAITRGSYSDYRVLAVFATKKDAEHAIEMARISHGDHWGDPDSVTVLPLYDPGEEPQIVTTHRFVIELWDDGSEGDLKHSIDHEWEYSMVWPQYNTARPHVRYVRAPVHRDKGGRLEVGGTDELACRKVVSDQIAQWKAQGYRLNQRNVA